MYYILMGIGIFFSILSIFTFSLGWEMWRKSLNTGSLIGEIHVQNSSIKFTKRPTIKLLELDGKHIDSQLTREDGKFIFSKIDPGQYLLDTEGDFIQCPEKTVNVFPSRDSDVGVISCNVNENKFWKNHSLGAQLLGILNSENNATWVTGFRTDKNLHNTYVLFKLSANSDKWKEIIIPEIHNAERGTFLHQFNTGEICLGTNGESAIITDNQGKSWKKLKLPSDISSISNISETANNTWFIVGQRLNVKAGIYLEGKPRTVILTSKNKGIDWSILSERDDTITEFVQHSSGRIIIGTNSLDGKGGIYYSDDGGVTWAKSQLGKVQSANINWRGIGKIIELKNGTLLAGSLDGKNWKGEFLQGGRLLISENAGKTWTILAGDETWGSINAILEIKNSVLLASEGSNLIWSTDNGINWFHFGKGFSSWINDIIEVDNRLMVITTSGVHEILKNKIIINYIDNENTTKQSIQ